MTRDETIAIMGILKTAYPSFYRDMTRETALQAIALWTEMFANDRADIVTAAVKTLIKTRKEGYPPTVGEVSEVIRELKDGKGMTEQEAWSLVEKACTRGIYDYEEEFYKLPPVVQKAVGSPLMIREWALMDASTVKSVVASNFQRSFRVMQRREEELAMLPEDVKAMLGGVTERLALHE